MFNMNYWVVIHTYGGPFNKMEGWDFIASIIKYGKITWQKKKYLI